MPRGAVRGKPRPALTLLNEFYDGIRSESSDWSHALSLKGKRGQISMYSERMTCCGVLWQAVFAFLPLSLN